MKKPSPIDSDELTIKDILGDHYNGHFSDQELHKFLQDLIDSDDRLLIEIEIVAWHDTYLLNAKRKI